MNDNIYYCFCSNDCKFETMTKEQIIAAIAEATGHTPTNIDDAFITKIKEQNKGETVTVWLGTTAEYNALETKDDNCIYIKTDDTTLEDVNKEIEAFEEETERRLTAFSEEIKTMQPYGDMESLVLSGMPLYGYITSDCGVLVLFLPLSKPISKTVDNIIINALDVFAIGVQGIINNSKIVTSTIDYFVTATICENGIKFEIHHATGSFTNAVNSTPVICNSYINITFTNSNAMSANEGAE